MQFSGLISFLFFSPFLTWNLQYSVSMSLGPVTALGKEVPAVIPNIEPRGKCQGLGGKGWKMLETEPVSSGISQQPLSV